MIVFHQICVQITKGLECLQRIDSTIPRDYQEEFSRIAPLFVEPYCRFMQEVRGPAYRPPVFEHVHLSDGARRPTLGGTQDHDIVDMTQPSQQVSQPSRDVSQSSSSRPEKINDK